MQKPKLVFSDAELQLALNTEFILTKNRIIHKVYEQFGILASLLIQELNPLSVSLPEIFNKIPKISKGENYGGLPWVMLDYPRYFSGQQGHFAFRCFFGWGMCYVVQWQVSGPFIPPFQQILQSNLIPEILEGSEVYCGFPDDPYVFSCKQAGMKPVSESRFQVASNSQKKIMKIMTEVPIMDYEKLNNVTTTMARWAIQAFRVD